uniref:Candidate secreted effector n=2 Tax=Meloidogyne incognita TaxID=6306 RepID=A0A914MSW6_MELIC
MVFILFLCLISKWIEGANLPSSVAPIQHTTTNVGEMAPASYENVNGVNYPNIPFYGNPKNTHKEKDNGLGKVDISNRFSVLQGLTEENQEKMLGSKPEIEEECEEGCEEECVEEVVIDTSQLNIKQTSSAVKNPNRKLLQYERERPSYKEDRPNFSDRTNTCCCCLPNWVRVIVVGALTLPGLLLNYTGNVMDCKICKY